MPGRLAGISAVMGPSGPLPGLRGAPPYAGRDIQSQL